MELIYRPKKPETIKRFMFENNIPLKLVDIQKGKQMLFVNHEQKTKDDTIKKGDNLKIIIPDEPYDPSITPEAGPLDIRYEDEYYLIVNKPANMQVMVSNAHPTGTLANLLNHYYQSQGIHAKIHFINRLDKETSGLMFIAKHRFLKFLFSDKTDNKVEREYYAIVDGLLENKKLCIELPINRVEGSIKREVSMTGEECQTAYQVEKEFNHYSLVRIISETGKTHQIRVHFAHFRLPIVGDELYNANRYPVSEMLLMSHRIAFTHPLKDTKVEVILPLSNAFESFMNRYNIK